jgi:hypothetical protein
MVKFFDVAARMSAKAAWGVYKDATCGSAHPPIVSIWLSRGT